MEVGDYTEFRHDFIGLIKAARVNDIQLFRVIVKDLPLYKGVGSYGYHGVAPVSKLVS